MIPQFQGSITEWDEAKGYGWVKADKQRIFLHRKDFADRTRRPLVGDWVRFTAGKGPNGLTCAQDATFLNPGRVSTTAELTRRKPARPFGIGSVILLGGLLVLPAMALARLPFAWWEKLAAAAFLSAATFVINASDKRRARMEEWRTAEATLHLLELAGGWPGAFLAHRVLRHKCSKRSYQAVFWMIVALHEWLALDFLRDWEWTGAMIAAVEAGLAKFVGP